MTQIGGEPRLADAGIADHRHELAPVLPLDALPRFPDDRELALAPDEPCLMPPLRRVANSQEPIGGDRLGLALQLEGLDGFDLDRLAHQRERRPPDQHLARLRACSSLAATLTASPKPLLGPGHHLAGRDADPSLADPARAERPASLWPTRTARNASSSCAPAPRRPPSRRRR